MNIHSYRKNRKNQDDYNNEIIRYFVSFFVKNIENQLSFLIYV